MVSVNNTPLPHVTLLSLHQLVENAGLAGPRRTSKSNRYAISQHRLFLGPKVCNDLIVQTNPLRCSQPHVASHEPRRVRRRCRWSIDT